MHLVMIIARFKPYIGGAEKQAERMARAMIKKGWRVSILTRGGEGLTSRELFFGINIVRLPFLPWGILAPLTFMCSCLYFLWHHRHDINLIHAHQHDSAFTGALAKMFFGKPVIAHFHGGLHNIGSEVMMLSKGWKGKLMVWLVKKYTDAFIAVSNMVSDDLKLLVPPQKIYILPNGVDLKDFHPVSPAEKTRLRSQLDLPPEAVIFVFSGRLEPVKGIDILIRAWNHLPPEGYPSALLVVLGTGSQLESVREQGKKSAPLLVRGAVENVSDYLQAADVFVMPSRYEGTSLAVLEAMASELPVLLTRVGGNADIINHQENGILIPPEDPEKLMLWMKILSGDEELRHRLGKAGHETVRNHFSFEKIMYNYHALCRTVTGKNLLSQQHPEL